MPAVTLEIGETANVTATADIGRVGADVSLIGFYVNSTTAGTVVVRKGGASGTVVSGTITPAVGFHRFPAACPGGAHVTVGGTLDATFFYVSGIA